MPLEDNLRTSVANACRKAGGQAALARILHVRQSTVSSWLRRGNELPAEYVLRIEFALGIPRYELRPDIYPPEEHVSTAPQAQHPAAQPSASVMTPPPPRTGADGSSPALDYPGEPAMGDNRDPLSGVAA